MITILSLVLFIVFVLLSSIHFYWLFGGKWGLKQVIPTKNDTENFRPPPKFATLVVAITLMLFGLVYLIKSGLVDIQIPLWIARYCYWIIPLIFILRAIGEFNYVGFFKKVRNTDFAKADSKWFSPLCLIIGIIGIAIQLMNNNWW